jgi:probable rRNA maturation factor
MEKIRKNILDIAALLKKENWDISIVFCGNDHIRDLNKRFRNKDEPTDALTFPLGEFSGKRFLAGDIVVSLETVRENADYFNVPFEEELYRVLIHGILHLDGMDHSGHLGENAEKNEPMLELQEKILSELRRKTENAPSGWSV